MLSEIFKTAFFVYARSFKYVLLISLFVNIPRNTIIFFIPDRWLVTFEMFAQMDFAGMLPAMIISYTVSILFEPLAYAGFVYLAREALAGENIAVTGILDNTLLKWPALMVTTLFYYVFVLIGSILIIPAIYAVTVFAFYIMVVVERDKWGMSALLESARIVKGNFFRTLLVLALVVVLSLFTGNFVSFAVYVQHDFTNRLINIIMFTLRDTYVAYFSMVTVAYYFYLTKPKGDDNASEQS